MLRALTALATLAAVLAVTEAALADLLPPAFSEGLEDLVRIAADTCEVLPLETLFSRASAWELPLVRVQAWTRRGRRSYRVTRAPPAPHTTIYVPGWWNTPDDEAATALVDALLTRQERVLVLDTRLSFCRGYLSAASRVRALGHLLYSLIRNFASRGLPPESIHLIGFSLGAHVAGVAGKLVTANTGGKVGKITALDPARPCFETPATSAHRLTREDARFVQVVHTSSGVLGLERPAGHVDVYMNGLTSGHPECDGRGVTLECAHSQAWRLYAASVLDPNALRGSRCAGWEDLRRGRCVGNETALGYGCGEDARGVYLHRSDGTRKKTAVGSPPFGWLGLLGR